MLSLILMIRFGVYQFLYRIFDFFRFWYWDSLFSYWGFVFRIFNYLERTIAFRITLRYFFRPLYGDYTVIGRVLGITFRSLRVVLGFVFYLLFFCVFAVPYIAWDALPIYLIYRIIASSL